MFLEPSEQSPRRLNPQMPWAPGPRTGGSPPKDPPSRVKPLALTPSPAPHVWGQARRGVRATWLILPVAYACLKD